jgi:hypothetical protein
VVGSCEHGNDPLHSMKGDEFDQLSTYQLLNKVSASWSWITK